MSVIKETIYETPDVDEAEDVPEAETFENKEVERVHLNLDAALKRFAGRFISSENTDFSEFQKHFHTRSRPKGYSTGHYIFEYAGPEYDQNETADQKFNRIQMEIAELNELVEMGEENTKPDVNFTKNHLDQLTQQLQAVLLKKANADTPAVKKLAEEQKAAGGVASSSNLDALMVARFETRIRKLEEALGTIDYSTAEFVVPGPLTSAIDDLRLRVESLNPSNLEAIETRLNSALAKQSQLHEKKDSNTELIQQVNEIYHTVNKFKDSSQTVSAVIKRLRALAQIHEQASEFSSKLNELHATKNHIRESLDINRATINEFSDEFKKVIDNIRNEIEAVRKHVNK